MEIAPVITKPPRSPVTFDFASFPPRFSLTGPFETTITHYLDSFAEKEESSALWRICLLHGDGPEKSEVTLYTKPDSSDPGFCALCKSAGWGDLFASKRKFHVIIPAQNKPLDTLYEESHLLHGIIHCSGIGHLICLNGKEGGSCILNGREIMDLWDRICTRLHVRKISVKDISMKRSMDLRLIHGIAYGHSWFGRWDYKYHSVSSELTAEMYNTAVENLSSIQLDHDHFSSGPEIQLIVSYYRAKSESKLLTIRHIVRFMLNARVDLWQSNRTVPKDIKEVAAAAGTNSSYPPAKLEDVVSAVRDVLNVADGRHLTRESIRDAVRKIKGFGKVATVDKTLKLMRNQKYIRIGTDIIIAHESSNKNVSFSLHHDVYADVCILYKRVLLGSPEAQWVINGKTFVKEWKFSDLGVGSLYDAAFDLDDLPIPTEVLPLDANNLDSVVLARKFFSDVPDENEGSECLDHILKVPDGFEGSECRNDFLNVSDQFEGSGCLTDILNVPDEFEGLECLTHIQNVPDDFEGLECLDEFLKVPDGFEGSECRNDFLNVSDQFEGLECLDDTNTELQFEGSEYLNDCPDAEYEAEAATETKTDPPKQS